MFMLGALSQQAGGQPLLNGLVSWFPMEEADGEHKIDVHGPNTTNISQSIANLTRVLGKQGSGTDFPNGSSVHCQPPTGVPSGDNSWAVALWVKLDTLTTDTFDHLVSITDNNVSSNAADGWHIGYRNGAEDAFDVTVRVGSTRYNANASTFGTPSTGVWYFLYAYYDADANQCGISINNGTIDTATVTGTPNTKTASFNIGRWGYTGGFPFYLDGKMDEIGIWNRTLTADELTYLYNGGGGRSYYDLVAVPAAITTNLEAWWNMDEDADIRHDWHGGHHLSDNATVSAAQSNTSQAAKFVTANSEYLDIATSPFDFNSDWTISGWFNLTSVGGAVYPCILSSATGGTAATLEVLLEFDDASDDKLRLYCGQSTAYKNVAWGTALGAGEWHHFIIYYDVSATTIGISVDNGTAVENNAVTINSLASPFFRIGRWATGADRYFDGLIDEVAIWSRLLSADEKTWLYNSGAGRSYDDALSQSVQVFDTFTDTSTTNLYNHTPEIDRSGAGWGRAGTSSVQINGNNQAQGITSIHSYIIDGTVVDTVTTADFGFGSTATDAKGIWVRLDQTGTWPTSVGAGNNSWLVGINSPNSANPVLAIYEYISGGYNLRASTTLTGEGSLVGETWPLKAWSDSDKVYGEITVNGTTYNVEYASTAGNDHTYVGLRVIGTDTCDNFRTIALGQ